MKKTKVYIDMDGVIADFCAGVGGEMRGYGEYPEMYRHGYFENLPLIEGALEYVRKIALKYDVYILTQPVMQSAHSYSEKVTWILKHFPELMGKIIMTQEKGLLARDGDVLIDDNGDKWAGPWKENDGYFFHFDTRKKPLDNWNDIMKNLEHYCGKS